MGLKALGVFSAVLALTVTQSGHWFGYQLILFGLRALAWALGVALGLGWATHVYEQLDWMKSKELEQESRPERQNSKNLTIFNNNSSDGLSPAGITGTLTRNANFRSARLTTLEDDQTYSSLMQAAGYLVSGALRGQCMRRDENGENQAQPRYLMDKGNTALETLDELFGQAIPTKVQLALSKWIELILRDFVVSWYAGVDSGVEYKPPSRASNNSQQEDVENLNANDNFDESSEDQQEMRENLALNDINDDGTITTEHVSSNMQHPPPTPKQFSIRSGFARKMIYSTAQQRSIPVLDSIYQCVAHVVGNLATRVEHVNVFEVVLLKWTRILAQTFATYRQFRKNALRTIELKQRKQTNNDNALTSSQSASSRSLGTANNNNNNLDQSDEFQTVSEMAVTREFLLAGKLHRAITFGADLPSLLFADASGQECGVGEGVGDISEWTADQVLEYRLFSTPFLKECQLDYNRVLGHRMVRALLTRADFGSPAVAAIVTEIMASCVLTPVMEMFGPDYINGWILMGLEPAKKEDIESTSNAKKEKKTVEASSASKLVAKNPKITDTNSSSALDAPKPSSGRLPSVVEENNPHPSSEGFEVELDESSHHQLDLLDELSWAIEDLGRFVNFDQIRRNISPNSPNNSTGRAAANVQWDDPACRMAVVRVVLIVEAALLDGRCVYQRRSSFAKNDETESSIAEEPLLGEKSFAPGGSDRDDQSFALDEEDETEALPLENEASPPPSASTFSHLLMEMTGDVDAFEERVAAENSMAALIDESADLFSSSNQHFQPYTLTATEQSTVRTLIAAWLHTGQISRMVTVMVQAHATLLAPHYQRNAFLRSPDQATAFVRLLQVLDQVDLLVDTMEVLSTPQLTASSSSKRRLLKAKASSSMPQSTTTVSQPQTNGTAVDGSASSAVGGSDQQQQTTSAVPLLLLSSAIPRHFDFHRNEAFAASLRSERERRMQSWYSQFEETSSTDDGNDESLIVCRQTTENEIKIHMELHQMAKIFYNGTNQISIRDATRRRNASTDIPISPTSDDQQVSQEAEVEEELLSLLTVETACPRRRIEVPDDDSSFLLRAQPRPLQAVGVHRDQRNHDQSFRCFAATYEEPALKSGSDHFAGGRYVRRCMVRYYPIDRTASIFLQNDVRKLDQRIRLRQWAAVPDTIVLGSSSNNKSGQTTPFLSVEFLRDRHICHRWIPKGTNRTHSMLAGNVMEPTDFTAQPRTGKAMDFVYRMSLFEKPMIELSGKKFTVHDSSALGTHRADASSMEVTDAALSTALLMLGVTHNSSTEGEEVSQEGPLKVQMGQDGYPIIWMKFSKQNDTQVEVKPYRVSFVRAALLLTAARQEAQLQSLISCVKAGSAKNATRKLTDARLRPTMRLLYHASHPSREKQSLLLRDLKLGINHIDREQLRRNGLLNPRYPTSLKDISVVVEDALQAEEVRDAILFGMTGTVYKIKCTAIVELISEYEDHIDEACYGSNARKFREEWVVYRSFKEFQTLHKHLKNIVSSSESSGNAVTRLSASLQATTSLVKKNRGALVPSLSQVSKIGTLGLTKKALQKRKEHLEGYLSQMLSPNNLLSRCPELLLFVGAFYPLPPAVTLHVCVSGLPDPLGRTKMVRTIIEEEPASNENPADQDAQALVAQDGAYREDEEDGAEQDDSQIRNPRKNALYMLPAIRHKIDKVTLSQVRNRLFELLRNLFDFENASFMRNRMLAALKTASFAVTSSSEFRRMLYNLHIKYLSTFAIADWIDYVRNIIWPDGIFFTSSPPMTPEQLIEQMEKCKTALHTNFPDALRTILGQDLTHDGLDILHEMLQNRVVVRSMAYMLFDILWLEVFPEIGDVIQGGAALEVEQ